MGLALEIFYLILSILWSILENAYRVVIPVPRKKIDGEIVLITGGGGGIAECIAMEMIKLNVKIVLWDINEEANERVAKKLREEGATVFAFRCDITDKDEVYQVAEEVKRQVGHVTILVNNAGVMYCHSFLNTSDKELMKTVQVNTISHFWTTKAFLPHMCEINHGHIVTIASFAGLYGIPNLVGYSASKYGAVGFHHTLGRELLSQGKSGVKTTCVCPTFVDTNMITNTKVTIRFPSLVTMLKPQDVAKALIEGMLRDKGYILIPIFGKFILFINGLLPEQAMIAIGEFMGTKMEEGDTKQSSPQNKEDEKIETKSE